MEEDKLDVESLRSYSQETVYDRILRDVRGLSVPSFVPAEEKKPLYSERRKIPIITANIKAEDGLYYTVPTMGDIMMIYETIVKHKPDIDDKDAVLLVTGIVAEQCTNFKVTEHCSTLDHQEISNLIVSELSAGFFSAIGIYKERLLKDKIHSDGSIE